MKRLEELKKELKAKGGRAGEAQRRASPARQRRASPARKEKRLNKALEKVYGQVADRSRKRLKKRGNIKIEDLMNKGKEDIAPEAAKAMGSI